VVCLDVDPKWVKKYRQQYGLTIRLICDGQGTYGEAARSYQYAGDCPGVFVIDPGGRLETSRPGVPSLAELRAATGWAPAPETEGEKRPDRGQAEA